MRCWNSCGDARGNPILSPGRLRLGKGGPVPPSIRAQSYGPRYRESRISYLPLRVHTRAFNLACHPGLLSCSCACFAALRPKDVVE